MPLQWRRIGAGRRLKDRQYVAGPYRIDWLGSSHGIWVLTHNGERLDVCALLKNAKQCAEDHAGRQGT